MQSSVRHASNPARFSEAAAEAAARGTQNLLGWNDAVQEIHTWPEYEPQPLRSLPAHARELGIAQLYYKDESARYGRELGSFKALGAPYSVFALARDAVEAEIGRKVSADELRSGEFREITDQVTVCVATDGNQGRGLAYGASVFGCRCVIYVHRHVSDGRVKAMRDLGAIVIRVDGEYEASVARAKGDAAMNGWHFVSSTSWTDFDDPLPKHVMNAYMVMVEETIDQLRGAEPVTHVIVAGGVGSIAAAMFLGFYERYSAGRPRCVVFEPAEADCLQQTVRSGTPTPAPGTLGTIMAGLACREVSPAAWKLLSWLASDFVTIPDHLVVEAMVSLASGGGDIPVVSGESAAGGMAVLLAAQSDPDLRESLGLNEESRVVLFGGEGATDPHLYQQFTGLTPDEVFNSQARFAADAVNA